MWDQRALWALLLSLGAGLSTMLGAVIIFFTKGKNERLISISLGFAAGIMISVSAMDLFPNALLLFETSVNQRLSVLLVVLFFALGIALALLLDCFVPHADFDLKSGETPHKDLFRVGFVSMMAVGLHNFPEGMATFMAAYGNLSLGVTIAVAIALHNIPEGIVIAMPVYFATGSRKKAVQYTLYSALAEPLGALLCFLVLRPFINDAILATVFSAIAGIMIYIAVEELIPSSRQYGFDRAALFATLIGFCAMPLTHAL